MPRHTYYLRYCNVKSHVKEEETRLHNWVLDIKQQCKKLSEENQQLKQRLQIESQQKDDINQNLMNVLDAVSSGTALYMNESEQQPRVISRIDAAEIQRVWLWRVEIQLTSA